MGVREVGTKKTLLGQTEVFLPPWPMRGPGDTKSEYPCPCPEMQGKEMFLGSGPQEVWGWNPLVPLSMFPSGETPQMYYHLLTHGSHPVGWRQERHLWEEIQLAFKEASLHLEGKTHARDASFVRQAIGMDLLRQPVRLPCRACLLACADGACVIAVDLPPPQLQSAPALFSNVLGGTGAKLRHCNV